MGDMKDRPQDWKLPPDFTAPIIQPEKTFWQKIRPFFSPSVNAAIVTSGLALVSGVLFLNSNSKLGELRHTVVTLQGENNKLTTEKEALKTQYSVYSGIPLRVPEVLNGLARLLSNDPTNQQKLSEMMGAVQSVTNLLAEIAAIPRLDLEANGCPLTNNTTVTLDRSRTVFLKVFNRTPMTAERVYVDVLTPLELDPTNFITEQFWHLMPRSLAMSNNTIFPIMNHWRWEATTPIPGYHIDDDLIGVESTHSVDYFHISTNYNSFKAVRMQIGVFANRSRYTVHDVLFLLP